MISNEEVQNIAADVLPNVLRGLRREIEESALREAKQAAQREVTATVEAFVKQEIVPEIHKALTESRDGLIAMAPVLAASISESLAEALKASIAKKLETSWERKKLFEALIA